MKVDVVCRVANCDNKVEFLNGRDLQTAAALSQSDRGEQQVREIVKNRREGNSKMATGEREEEDGSRETKDRPWLGEVDGWKVHAALTNIQCFVF